MTSSGDRDAARCRNCGSARGVVRPGALLLTQPLLTPAVCVDCNWPVDRPVPDAPLCSVCRRRHGAERIHAAE